MGNSLALGKSVRAVCLAVSAIAAALTLGAQPAAASGGDWGFNEGIASTALTGGKMVTYPALICNPTTPRVQGTGPCSYTTSMIYRITTFGGARFVTGTSNAPNPDNSTTPPNPKTFPLVLSSTGAPVGTCKAEQNHQVIECSFSAAGSIASGDSVVPGKQIVMWTATETCTPFFQLTWYDPAQEPQRWGNDKDGFNDLFGANDWYVAKTFGRCPKVEP
ncbi:hypothetical protein OV450_8410 [Actinobacteria bacterium OV450]|jgi:hypothetical protein|nr:hypothetical protein OV450_8410 [Actinobacteria bacterium OV450]